MSRIEEIKKLSDEISEKTKIKNQLELLEIQEAISRYQDCQINLCGLIKELTEINNIE